MSSTTSVTLEFSKTCIPNTLKIGSTISTIVISSLAISSIIAGPIAGWSLLGLSGAYIFSAILENRNSGDATTEELNKRTLQLVLGILSSIAVAVLSILGGVGVISGFTLGIAALSITGSFIALNLATRCFRSHTKSEYLEIRN